MPYSYKKKNNSSIRSKRNSNKRKLSQKRHLSKKGGYKKNVSRHGGRKIKKSYKMNGGANPNMVSINLNFLKEEPISDIPRKLANGVVSAITSADNIDTQLKELFKAFGKSDPNIKTSPLLQQIEDLKKQHAADVKEREDRVKRNEDLTEQILSLSNKQSTIENTRNELETLKKLRETQIEQMETEKIAGEKEHVRLKGVVAKMKRNIDQFVQTQNKLVIEDKEKNDKIIQLVEQINKLNIQAEEARMAKGNDDIYIDHRAELATKDLAIAEIEIEINNLTEELNALRLTVEEGYDAGFKDGETIAYKTMVQQNADELNLWFKELEDVDDKIQKMKSEEAAYLDFIKFAVDERITMLESVKDEPDTQKADNTLQTSSSLTTEITDSEKELKALREEMKKMDDKKNEIMITGKEKMLALLQQEDLGSSDNEDANLNKEE